jgi:hypothetical protein
MAIYGSFWFWCCHTLQFAKGELGGGRLRLVVGPNQSRPMLMLLYD